MTEQILVQASQFTFRIDLAFCVGVLFLVRSRFQSETLAA